jgi:hypothetical protein
VDAAGDSGPADERADEQVVVLADGDHRHVLGLADDAVGVQSDRQRRAEPRLADRVHLGVHGPLVDVGEDMPVHGEIEPVPSGGTDVRSAAVGGGQDGVG